ncbi:MAG: 30S ribosomal protein S20 [Patescibacteria group bacterium]
MPITKSAKKALRQNKKRRVRNVAKKQKIKALKKEYLSLTKTQDLTRAKEKISQLYKSIDKAAKTKTIHKNKAARLKSRLSKKAVSPKS